MSDAGRRMAPGNSRDARGQLSGFRVARPVVGMCCFERKGTIALAVFMGLLLLSGLVSRTAPVWALEQPNEANGAEIQKDLESTVHIAFVAMSTTAPQALINHRYHIYDEELGKIGKRVKYTSTRSLDNLYPLMDKQDGDPDFVYIPHSAFTTYTTKTSKYGGSDKYAIVAGSLDLSDIDLVTRPEILSLEELGGKVVAISNLRYSDEFQLNKLLSTVGLKTDTVGGNVRVEWAGIVLNTLENYDQGLYDGIIVFNTNNRDLAVDRVPGSRVHKLNPPELYGGHHPRVWLAAKKELIRKDPALVRQVLKAHVLLDDRAKEDIGDLAAINRDVYLGYFENRGADMSAQNPIERFEERWKIARVTYDPNLEFTKELFNFMKVKGVIKGAIGDFVQITPLNEALEELGRPEIRE